VPRQWTYRCIFTCKGTCSKRDQRRKAINKSLLLPALLCATDLHHLTMSASSGRSGSCRICRHPNNEHNFHPCSKCLKRDAWKICQATGAHPNADGSSTRGLCKKCCHGGSPYSQQYIDSLTKLCVSYANSGYCQI
jgi:hypothetical protein